jgi:DNA-3-methyladenine glycosylase I
MLIVETGRCSWANTAELMQYHDSEWGIATYEDQQLFELLVLEMMQAGLSWATILRKRENFRIAFDDFHPTIVAQYDEAKVAALLGNAGIIRNKLKIHAVINNAKQFVAIQNEFGRFSTFIWQYVDHVPIVNQWKKTSEVPSATALSEKISSDLSKRGFKFVGPKIIYSFMQASGMVNDHLIDCARRNHHL